MPDRVYLDSCVVNRATDDHTQERIRLEASDIARILDAVSDGKIEWIASTVLTLEPSRNPIRKSALTPLFSCLLLRRCLCPQAKRSPAHSNYGNRDMDQ